MADMSNEQAAMVLAKEADGWGDERVLYETYITALRMGAAALREKQQRGEGCEACVDNGAYLSCGFQRQVFEYESEQFGINPSYCPNCGRALNEPDRRAKE